ncbi:MAG: cell division protein FtsZ [Myxococcales bacterium]|nr:cell division protein FtsZ [Myxococcales bacterium]
MAISIEFPIETEQHARIKVVGVGGSGGNALNTMITEGLAGVEFIAANTDIQALDANLASYKIQLGPQLTRGLGAGGNPDVGRKAAQEDLQKLSEALAGSDMVFVTAGMGGGTGTGAAPIIAQVAKDQGALTVGVVTKPFGFEGRRRSRNAERGIQELIDSVDSIVTIPNQKLLSLGESDLTMLEAFQKADDVLLQAVQGISDLIIHHGMINVDFADVKTIMSNNGRALMGTGYSSGERRALEAAQNAINSPLLDDISVEGARGILINFTAGTDIKLKEIHEAASLVQEAAHEDAEVIFGVVTDPEMAETVKVTVIATGFDQNANIMDAAAYGTRRSRGRASSTANGYGVEHQQHYGAPPQQQPQYAPQHHVQDQAVAYVPAAGTRAFGASALHDEAVLDIPAYLRRGQGPRR